MLEIELESETATNWNKCNRDWRCYNWNKCNRDDGMVA